ncbi:hypothetical protein SAC06_04275 [Scrofimicrobium sp. R131]|uniref:Uncharacterized protein n=1 Tax=Scrofimicrobium appendicitidis TaxID=3079930 RepID=A0AAU7V9K2_9ACTO
MGVLARRDDVWLRVAEGRFLVFIDVDAVGEVGGEDLVGRVFQPAPVGGGLGEFVGSGGEALVECRLDLLGEADVPGLVDRDVGVAVSDELLDDGNGDCTARALGFAGASASVGVVGVLGALLVHGELAS